MTLEEAIVAVLKKDATGEDRITQTFSLPQGSASASALAEKISSVYPSEFPKLYDARVSYALYKMVNQGIITKNESGRGWRLAKPPVNEDMQPATDDPTATLQIDADAAGFRVEIKSRGARFTSLEEALQNSKGTSTKGTSTSRYL